MHITKLASHRWHGQSTDKTQFTRVYIICPLCQKFQLELLVLLSLGVICLQSVKDLNDHKHNMKELDTGSALRILESFSPSRVENNGPPTPSTVRFILPCIILLNDIMTPTTDYFFPTEAFSLLSTQLECPGCLGCIGWHKLCGGSRKQTCSCVSVFPFTKWLQN